MQFIIIILWFFIAFINSAHAEVTYDCMDHNGNTIFTDIPQDGMKCVLRKGDIDSAQKGIDAENEQKQLQLAESHAMEQPAGSLSTQPIDQLKQNPVPYNCIKICLQDNRNKRKACSKNDNDYHSCMTKYREDLNQCRQECHKERSTEVSNNAQENNIKAHSSITPTSRNSILLQTENFSLVDKRNPAEREGYPYPDSPLRHHVMHGDRSLSVDRLSILKAKLIERLGSKLKGKVIELTQFYVLEATMRNAFVKTPSGKQMPNTGPFLPTLVSEITITFDDDFFHGSVHFPLSLGAKSTKSALTMATTIVIDDLIKDMERRWEQ